MENIVTDLLIDTYSVISYQQDILGENFESAQIEMPMDYEGRVVCTVVRRRPYNPSGRAVLYVHGFNDYFFQAEMAKRYNETGFTFYAVDLRKYGRSYLKHQKFNNVRDLSEYYQDIDAVLAIIKQENNNEVVLSGHSTGGLVVALYASQRTGSSLFNAVFLNSPFFEFNLPSIDRITIPIAAKLGAILPDKLISGGFSKLYGQSLHKSEYGEWDYDLQLKPHKAPNVNLGWLRAIYNGHRQIKRGIQIDKPVLIMISQLSVFEKKWNDKMFTGDAILNVKDIKKRASKIQGDVTVLEIKGAMHDLVLSGKAVREEVYKKLFEWLESCLKT